MSPRLPTILLAFLDGLAAAFTLMPLPPSRLHRTDADALASDWRAIGQDMQLVIESVERHMAGRDGKRGMR